MCLLALCERAKSRNDWCFRLRLYEYFLCQAFQFRERLDATTTFCNVADRFTLRSLTLFRVCSCVYVNFSFMKRQQKLSLFLRQTEWQRKVKIKVNWRRQMTKVEKLVQQRVNPQKLQNFQSSRRPQQVPLWENSVFIIIIIIWPSPFLKWPNLKCHVGHLTHFP